MALAPEDGGLWEYWRGPDGGPHRMRPPKGIWREFMGTPGDTRRQSWVTPVSNATSLMRQLAAEDTVLPGLPGDQGQGLV